MTDRQALLDDADELMADHARESHITLDDLEVRVADARRQHAHERFSFGGPRDRYFRNPYLAVKDDRPHNESP